LLEAMEERQVTVDVQTYRLPKPFMVIATQNPVELEGTYPLPEAQLDRFLLRLQIGYPDRDAELAILDVYGEGELNVDELQPVCDAETIAVWSKALTSIHIARELQGYVVDLVDATRHHRDLMLGVSPRGALALQRASRALAASVGRAYVVPDDIKSLAPSILEHRMVLSAEAMMRGVSATDVLASVLDTIPVPANRQV
jgi:MoxR-like ATPase